MKPRSALSEALGRGDLAAVQALAAQGADLHYVREGYTALIDAVHGRDVVRDAGLPDLLRWLIAQRVDLDAISPYGESGLRVLSRLGRFDAVRLLLDAGADVRHLEFTPLHHAVAFGSLDEVRALLPSADLEARDRWSRTPLLLAAQVGDIAKFDLLLDAGADPMAVGRCGHPLLTYAVEVHRPDVLQALIDRGADVEAADDFGETPLMAAAESDDAGCIAVLLAAGARLDRQANGDTALGLAGGAAAVRALLAAGADPAELSGEGKRLLLGFPAEPDESALEELAQDDFAAAGQPRIGRTNGEEITHPYLLAMIRAGVNAYVARRRFLPGRPLTTGGPYWCAERFGQSVTLLPDGRIVLVAGEHEDFYDPDFCIYNDVWVQHPDGRMQVFGYPAEVFPPTDFHSATLAGEWLWIIGTLGYVARRRTDTTPVYRLHLPTMRMDAVATRGPAPAWLHRHRARLLGDGSAIECTGGCVLPAGNAGGAPLENRARWRLALRAGEWSAA